MANHHHACPSQSESTCKVTFNIYHWQVIHFISLHLIKLESLSPKDALCQICLKLFQWFWKILNFINVFPLFRHYLPLEKGLVLHLNKLEFTSHKDVFCQVWLRLAQLYCRRFVNFVSVFSLFCNYPP